MKGDIDGKNDGKMPSILNDTVHEFAPSSAELSSPATLLPSIEPCELPTTAEEYHHKYCIHNVRKRYRQKINSPSLKCRILRRLEKAFSPPKNTIERSLVSIQRVLKKRV
ncbi:uncharacterized protein LOC111247888 isoform X1 [Varroa destructor]|uniref:Uncharacterized protein n=1 Tax=Varroa destructor TaxID=109461 RepID=A0A7M7ME16_VARDE|nr:uncharacterized protein LOC111247888 isoform X1 [Varroa destructor]